MPDPEMDIRHLELDVAGRPDRPDRLRFGDPVSGADHDRAEVEERDGEAVSRPDRDRPPVRG
jgi:hypothetical protein